MELHEILDQATAQIPPELMGVERQRAVGSVVDDMDPAARDFLRGYMNGLLAAMATNNASDIDLGGDGSNGRVWYRIYGRKKPEESISFTTDQTDVLLQSLLVNSQRRHLLRHRNLDFSYSVRQDGQNLRFRADLYFELEHLALNMRHLPGKVRPFKGLELHPDVVRSIIMTYDKQGLTLVTGITGSGKSTTLDTIIDANNQVFEGHIIIIGAPIETVHPSKRCIVRHREVGLDVMSFHDGAVQAMRQDPDIIVVGEMRNFETIDTVLELTDTGHKVFSTLHTSSAAESLDRLIGVCPPEEQNRTRERLADVLKCIIAQKLVPTLDGKLHLAKEVLLINPSVRAAIANDNINEIYQMMQEGQRKGMNTLEQDLKRLVEIPLISAETAMNYANNKVRMEELL